eukprot:7379389-Prymnesium_polylepis.1
MGSRSPRSIPPRTGAPSGGEHRPRAETHSTTISTGPRCIDPRCIDPHPRHLAVVRRFSVAGRQSLSVTGSGFYDTSFALFRFSDANQSLDTVGSVDASTGTATTTTPAWQARIIRRLSPMRGCPVRWVGARVSGRGFEP